jgi:hypothetical protein
MPLNKMSLHRFKFNSKYLHTSPRRVKRLLISNGAVKELLENEPLLAFMLDKLKKEVVKGHIRSNFCQNSVAQFFDMTPDEAQNLLFKHKASTRKRGSLITLVGAKRSRKFVIKPGSHSPSKIKVATSIAKRVKSSASEVTFRESSEVSFRSPDEKGLKRATGPKFTPYREVFRSSHATILIQASPDESKSPELELDVDFDPEFVAKYFSDASDDPTFEFTVTPDTILSRTGSPRPMSQKAAVGGYSAADVFKAMGIVFNDELKTRDCHLAHRRGWGVGGTQDKPNLDPSTAGGNYDTLFYIEDSIHYLISHLRVQSVHVQGNIVFVSDQVRLPQSITYTCTWNGDKTISKTIYPLSTRRPSVEEHRVARAVVTAEHERDEEPAISSFEEISKRLAAAATSLSETDEGGLATIAEMPIDEENSDSDDSLMAGYNNLKIF